MTKSKPNGALPATVVKRNAAPKLRGAPRRAHVALAQAKLAKKATPAKKGHKARTVAEVAKPNIVRPGSKTAKILDLLKRPGGVTSQELRKSTGWLPHSVRGFLSGTVGKKMGLTVTSTKTEGGERTYSVEV
jgi:hypothetical protein